VQFGQCTPTSCALCQGCLIAMQDKQNISSYVEPAPSTCTDQLAESPQRPAVTSVTCSDIKNKFFPGTLTSKLSWLQGACELACEMLFNMVCLQ
jgi:hypothetical protein